MSFNNGFVGTPRVAIICRGKTTQSISSWTTLTNWVEVQDPTNSFDPVTGIFTAPRAGLYRFTQGNAAAQPVGSYVGLAVNKNSTQLYNLLLPAANVSIQYLSNNGELEMIAGDTLVARSYCASASNDVATPSNSWFTISEVITNF